MEKKASVLVLVVLEFLLAACSSSQAAQFNPTVPASAAPPISAVDRLAVGILDLEDTDQAVSGAEAKALLPLWQQLKTLGGSSKTATADAVALATQIQGGLALDQVNAIDAMHLAAADVQSEKDELGISPAQGPAAASAGYDLLLVDAVIGLLTQRAGQ